MSDQKSETPADRYRKFRESIEPELASKRVKIEGINWRGVGELDKIKQKPKQKP